MWLWKKLVGNKVNVRLVKKEPLLIQSLFGAQVKVNKIKEGNTIKKKIKGVIMVCVQRRVWVKIMKKNMFLEDKNLKKILRVGSLDVH